MDASLIGVPLLQTAMFQTYRWTETVLAVALDFENSWQFTMTDPLGHFDRYPARNEQMNRKLIFMLVATILLSALVAVIAVAENRFRALSISHNYVAGYGSTLFICLFLIAIAGIIGSLALHRAKRSYAATGVLFLTMLAMVAMCSPKHARSVQNYFSHESRQSRLVEKINREIVLDNRFKNIKLSYWYGKGEGCSIDGAIQSVEDLVELEDMVKTRTDLSIDSDVDIVGEQEN